MSEQYMQDIFIPSKEYLHKKQDEREELIRIGRDITSYSKKAIFSLHRTFSENNDKVKDLSELVKHLQLLGTRLSQLKTIYDCNIALRGSVAGPVEELIEFFTFGHFVANRRLLEYKQFITYIKILLNATTEPEPYQAILESLFFNIDIPNKYESEVEVTFIDIGDYLMGLFDCTGEIMRSSIQHSSGFTGTLQLETTERQYRYLQDLYQQFTILTQKYPGISIHRGVFDNESRSKGNYSFMKKLEVFNNSIRKIETTLLDILISDKETI
ncbi:uncharacterized protein SPAPADRAFT_69925 [Spathaspora passalidarum NRRL Y-27907]|uniref:Translin n=1 Tax=Spathaspora passalidarum (strain NRRL Y-27907 / 11-Y1) TaxID=619300 RepID=G3AEV2_SPAPN|nr:uncharacterized protein SPAPADRAFT_69925 [Spathaspora passalidarum NRRL Y-27907]EGW35782.1 hypothetical protein SPAPADRAFT_69925 [Spathaspora passalidarum NRRL Y-27907]